MVDLFSAPHLLLSQNDGSWRYTDQDGTVVAITVQVAGPEPPRGLARHFGGDHHLARTVLRVDGPAGPLLFIDRAGVDAATPMQPPCALVAPDGTVLGRLEHDTAAFAQSYLAGLHNPHGADRRLVSFQQVYRLVDDQNRPLCTAAWEEVTVSALPATFVASTRASGGNHCVYRDPAGTVVARYQADGDLRFAYQLPQPMRALVTGSPIAMALMAAVTTA